MAAEPHRIRAPAIHKDKGHHVRPGRWQLAPGPATGFPGLALNGHICLLVKIFKQISLDQFLGIVEKYEFRG